MQPKVYIKKRENGGIQRGSVIQSRHDASKTILGVIHMTLGEKIAKQRKELEYTQEQLAEILGVSRQSVSKWESDLAYPETDKLIKMGKLFDCSMDYLLIDEISEKRGNGEKETAKLSQTLFAVVKAQFRERKSQKQLFGMPLYHIGRNARGVFAVGLKARGIFTIGLRAYGLVSLGLVSCGLLSFGLLSLGVVSVGMLSAGVLSIGTFALGCFALGVLSIGVIACGVMAFGCFSVGTTVFAKYFAYGDYARALIAVGCVRATGSVYEYPLLTSRNVAVILPWLDANVPGWLSWAKEITKFFLYFIIGF